MKEPRGADWKNKGTERSRNVIDNKALLFLEFVQSRNINENKQVSSTKRERC
jgi:hypothetical protein